MVQEARMTLSRIGCNDAVIPSLFIGANYR